jgi:hypothetical protein
MAKLFSQLSVIGEGSSPGSGSLARITPVRNIIRRHKWRLRPLKRFVLPVRHGKRQAVSLIRTVTPGMKRSPRIERSTPWYADHTGTCAATEIYPSEPLTRSPDPLKNGASQPRAKFSEPAYVFELKDINFWGRYGGSVLTADNALLGDLSPEVWGVENHPIFSRLRLPEPQHLSGRTAIAVTPEAPGNYYHWLIDLLPRFALIKAAGGDAWDAYARFLINGSGAHYEGARWPRSDCRWIKFFTSAIDFRSTTLPFLRWTIRQTRSRRGKCECCATCATRCPMPRLIVRAGFTFRGEAQRCGA